MPRLLDLFCGAGGAGEGYRRAGFDVTGVDNRPMPNNPHTFIQADALEYLEAHGHEYDAIHASPPCQTHSITRNIWKDNKAWQEAHVDLEGDATSRLAASCVIGNPTGAGRSAASFRAGPVLSGWRSHMARRGIHVHPFVGRRRIAVGA